MLSQIRSNDTTSARCNWNHLRSNLDFFCSKWPKYLHMAFKYIYRTFTHICLFCTSFQDKTSESQVTTFCIMTETKCTIRNSLFRWTTEWMQHCRFFLTIEYPFLYCCQKQHFFFAKLFLHGTGQHFTRSNHISQMKLLTTQ